MTKKFEMSMMGELTYFLGLQIKQDDKGISIWQERYTRNLLKKYEISDSSSVKTPMVPPNNLGPSLAGKPILVQSKRVIPKRCEKNLLSAKKQQSVAMSSIEAEYVAAAGCCANILWDHILKGDIELHFIPTEYQLTDIFTKPLDEPTFTRLKTELGMLNID
ncbi:retrovirus-related pol polyprotein from transposon TNT 1-94 [Tanacetum coccineum]